MHRFGTLARFFPHHLRERETVALQPSKPHARAECDFKRDIMLLGYDIPQKSDVLVIIPYFNACNSVRILQNLLLVQSKLEAANIPHVVAHCLFPDSNPIMAPSDKYFTVRSSSYAFMKECLANLAIKRYPTFSKYLVLDGDVVFASKDWYDEVSAKLDDVDVLQPYTNYYNMDFDYFTVMSEGKSIFAVYEQHKDMTEFAMWWGHPGYAIAFTRAFVDAVGYPDEALLGGGDTLVCSIVLGVDCKKNRHVGYLSEKYRTGKPMSICALDIDAYHLYHNMTKNRQYSTRYNIVDKYLVDGRSNIDHLIFKNQDGVFEWIDSVRDDMNADVLDYFSSRKDDECEVRSCTAATP